MARVFISYATPDRVIADEVLGWLRAAGHEPFLAHDHREGVSGGEDWKQRLYRELRAADAVIAVVTTSFLSSEWCFAELGIADARGCRLIPLRVEVGVVHPLMLDLQYVNYHAGPQQARDQLLQTLRSLEGVGIWREGDNPFPGLEPFTAALRQMFFGRVVEARTVVNQLRAMDRSGGVLAVVGPSGCGKSSLLNAAVAPLVDSDTAWLRVPTVVPGTDPLPELARALAATAVRVRENWSADDVRNRLEAGTDGLKRVANDLLATPGMHHRRLLVMIDQAEELFTRAIPTTDLDRFAQLLSGGLSARVQVVVVMRSEFLDDLRMLPALTGRLIEAYVVAPLSREMLREIIEKPAEKARLRLDAGLAAKLVADTDSGEALPLLAFILRQLAEDLPPGCMLSLSRYQELGGVQGALVKHADAALAEAVRVSGLTEPKVLTGLTNLVTVDDAGRRGRRRIRLPDPAEPLHAALGILVDRRLLVSDTDDQGQVWVTVAHEALLTKWQPLDAAISNIIPALRTARAVEQAAAEWINAGRPEHYLWDDKRLTTTLVTLGMADDNNNHPATPAIVRLDDDAWAFLDATARRVSMAKERESMAKERERRRRTVTIAVLFVLAVVASGFAIFAFYQRGVAFHQQRIATVRQLITQADAIRETDPRTALLLGIAAERIGSGGEARASLVNTLTTTRYAGTLMGHTSPVSSVAFSPDGHTVATGDSTGTVIIWDPADPARPRHLLKTDTRSVSSVAFSPDRRTLASGSFDGRVILWDLADLTRPRQFLETGAGSVFSVAFSPDGRTLAAGDSDGTAIIWDLADPARPRQFRSAHIGHVASVFSVAFSPDGRALATANDDGTAALWNLADSARPQHSLAGHTSSVNSVAFAPDGHTLATASDDGTALLWDLTDLTRPQQLRATTSSHTNKVTAVAFAPNSRILATANDDGTTLLWDLTDLTRPQPLRPALANHTGRVTAVAFSPDGRTVATAGADATVILWELTERAQPQRRGQPLTGQPSVVDSVMFTPDGRTLSAASSDNTVTGWDLTDPDRPRLKPPQTRVSHVVDSLAVAPDGHTLVTVGESGSVILWDSTDRTQPRALGQPLSGHHSPVTSAAFSTDGRTLVTAGNDGSVILWDLTDRTQPRALGQPLSGHTGSVTAVALTPDGNTLATGGSDATVILWNLTQLNQLRDHAMKRACAITGGGLDRAEWVRYIPGLPYEDTCL